MPSSPARTAQSWPADRHCRARRRSVRSSRRGRRGSKADHPRKRAVARGTSRVAGVRARAIARRTTRVIRIRAAIRAPWTRPISGSASRGTTAAQSPKSHPHSHVPSRMGMTAARTAHRNLGDSEKRCSPTRNPSRSRIAMDASSQDSSQLRPDFGPSFPTSAPMAARSSARGGKWPVAPSVRSHLPDHGSSIVCHRTWSLRTWNVHSISPIRGPEVRQALTAVSCGTSQRAPVVRRGETARRRGPTTSCSSAGNRKSRRRLSD